MNKRLLVLVIVSLLMLLGIGVAYANGPWEVSESGNGVVNGGYLPYYNVVETDFGWNFKWDAATGEVNGHLNFVEKLKDGKVRHFTLKGDQVFPVGDPTQPWIVFNCGYDGRFARSVRVEGFDDQGYRIAAHFRDSGNPEYPNSVWYWVKDPFGTVITNTHGPLPLSEPFSMICTSGELVPES